MKTYENIDQIVTIRVEYKKRCGDYEFKPSRKNWFGKVIESHWRHVMYSIGGNAATEYSAEEILAKKEDCYIEDNILWFKPYLKITYSNGKYTLVWFHDENGLELFIQKIEKLNPHIVNFEEL